MSSLKTSSFFFFRHQRRLPFRPATSIVIITFQAMTHPLLMAVSLPVTIVRYISTTKYMCAIVSIGIKVKVNIQSSVPASFFILECNYSVEIGLCIFTFMHFYIIPTLFALLSFFACHAPYKLLTLHNVFIFFDINPLTTNDDHSLHQNLATASLTGSCAEEEEREPGTHCSRMRQVPLLTCILLRYTKITISFCLPPERPHCMIILPVGYIRAVLKSKTTSL